jgi:spore coat assembly protein SafA
MGLNISGNYTIQSGDTMSRIAETHGVSLQELIKANPQISNPSLIKPGQAVKIPSGQVGHLRPDNRASRQILSKRSPIAGYRPL